MLPLNPMLGYILFIIFVFVSSTSLMAAITKDSSAIWFGLGISVFWSLVWFAL